MYQPMGNGQVEQVPVGTGALPPAVVASVNVLNNLTPSVVALGLLALMFFLGLFYAPAVVFSVFPTYPKANILNAILALVSGIAWAFMLVRLTVTFIILGISACFVGIFFWVIGIAIYFAASFLTGGWVADQREAWIKSEDFLITKKFEEFSAAHARRTDYNSCWIHGAIFRTGGRSEKMDEVNRHCTSQYGAFQEFAKAKVEIKGAYQCRGESTNKFIITLEGNYSKITGIRKFYGDISFYDEKGKTGWYTQTGEQAQNSITFKLDPMSYVAWTKHGRSTRLQLRAMPMELTLDEKKQNVALRFLDKSCAVRSIHQVKLSS